MSQITVAPEDPRSEVAAQLIADLCAELGRRYERPPSPFTLDEAADARAGLVVARLDGQPVGCGALRRIDEATVEIKRMYVAPAARRRGVARTLLLALERLAIEHGYQQIILETGDRQPEAMALYSACGYQRTANYGRYVDRLDAACFKKSLPSKSVSADRQCASDQDFPSSAQPS